MRAEEIKELRQRMGLSQNEFGHLFAVTGSIVTLWEKGTRVPDRFKAISMLKLKEKLDREKIGLSNISMYEQNKKDEIKKMLLLGGALAVLVWVFSKD